MIMDKGQKDALRIIWGKTMTLCFAMLHKVFVGSVTELIKCGNYIPNNYTGTSALFS